MHRKNWSYLLNYFLFIILRAQICIVWIFQFSLYFYRNIIPLIIKNFNCLNSKIILKICSRKSCVWKLVVKLYLPTTLGKLQPPHRKKNKVKSADLPSFFHTWENAFFFGTGLLLRLFHISDFNSRTQFSRSFQQNWTENLRYCKLAPDTSASRLRTRPVMSHEAFTLCWLVEACNLSRMLILSWFE